jgi:hypothetical protein
MIMRVKSLQMDCPECGFRFTLDSGFEHLAVH